MTTPPAESFTTLTPVDWLKPFLDIFRDDEDYGFMNRYNPADNVIQDFNVIQSIPEVIHQVPAIWVASEGFSPEGESDNAPTAFLTNFVAFVDIYLVALKNTTVTYDEKQWVVPSSRDENPTNNIFFLLLEYVGQKIKASVEIESGTLVITPKAWTGSEFFFSGFRGIPDARAMRLGFELEVERE